MEFGWPAGEWGTAFWVMQIKFELDPFPLYEVKSMKTLELKLNLPDRLAREAQAAGLLTPEALAQLLKDAMRRQPRSNVLACRPKAAPR